MHIFWVHKFNVLCLTKSDNPKMVLEVHNHLVNLLCLVCFADTINSTHQKVFPWNNLFLLHSCAYVWIWKTVLIYNPSYINNTILWKNKHNSINARISIIMSFIWNEISTIKTEKTFLIYTKIKNSIKFVFMV